MEQDPQGPPGIHHHFFQKVEHIGAQQWQDRVKKEWEILSKAGMKKAKLPPADAKKLHDVAYEETWKAVIKVAPEYGPKFKALTSPCKK